MDRWHGKVFGMLAGWWLSHRPAGVLLGLLVGHAFDAGWFRSPAADPYRAFGLADDASDADLDQAYRRLISRWHPDRFAGAAPALRRQAEANARELNAAYDRIKQARKK